MGGDGRSQWLKKIFSSHVQNVTHLIFVTTLTDLIILSYLSARIAAMLKSEKIAGLKIKIQQSS